MKRYSPPVLTADEIGVTVPPTLDEERPTDKVLVGRLENTIDGLGVEVGDILRLRFVPDIPVGICVETLEGLSFGTIASYDRSAIDFFGVMLGRYVISDGFPGVRLVKR